MMNSSSNHLPGDASKIPGEKSVGIVHAEELRNHYILERRLSDMLRNASKDERKGLYAKVYDEMFTVLDHPRRRKDQSLQISSQFRFLERYLHNDLTFLEIGAGDCSLSIKTAPYVEKAYALDVSDQIHITASQIPSNFTLIITDGISFPLKENSVDVAYCSSLIEHLHPEDVLEHLEHIYRVLRPGGLYICSTCNRLNGPHDISRRFDTSPTGFHLKEYTHFELNDIFRQIGFGSIRKELRFGTHFIAVPMPLVTKIEKSLEIVPRSTRLSLTQVFPFLEQFLYIRMVAEKAPK